MNESPRATEAQLEVIQAPPSARILVTAAAGTGKTFALVQRLARLVESDSLRPGTDLLVLSFSRAAVRELKKRLRKEASSASYVRSTTMDSYVSRLLFDYDPQGTWAGKDYDGRIRCAIELLRTSKEARERVAEYRHVLVDEIQDLVGVRGELLLCILEHIEGGFTLFGDPSQAIFNFSLKPSERLAASDRIYERIRSKFAEELIECQFRENYRALSANAAPATAAGELLRCANPDYSLAQAEIDRVLLAVPTWGKFTSAMPLLRTSSCSTAILCRDNGEALWMSRKLWNAGVHHALQRRSGESPVPPWLAIVLRGVDQPTLSRRRFSSIAEQKGIKNPDSLFQSMKRMERGRAPDLDLSLLADRVRAGVSLDDDDVDPEESLIVSTIHRAKGREFDRVILVVPTPRDGLSQEEFAEEVRTLYVALSRARRELYLTELSRPFGLRKWGSEDRWIRRIEAKTYDVELRADDLDSQDPTSTSMGNFCDAAELQSYLECVVQPGDTVSMELESTNGAHFFPVYMVLHDDRVIGRTGLAFSSALRDMLKLHQDWQVRYPTRIEELRLEGVDTVAGSRASALMAGLGSSGLFLRARVSGLGAPRFAKASAPQAQSALNNSARSRPSDADSLIEQLRKLREELRQI